MNITPHEYSLLFSVYGLPNIILPLLAGIYMDSKKGLSFVLLFTTAMNFVGQFIFALGAYAYNFNLMLLGRFLFGLGSESLYAC
jgi:MFS family permease